MSSGVLHFEVEEKFRNECGGQDVHEPKSLVYRGKVIESLQVCIRCRRRYPFRHGRKSCPFCSGLLIVKFMVLRGA